MSNFSLSVNYFQELWRAIKWDISPKLFGRTDRRLYWLLSWTWIFFNLDFLCEDWRCGHNDTGEYPTSRHAVRGRGRRPEGSAAARPHLRHERPGQPPQHGGLPHCRWPPFRTCGRTPPLYTFRSVCLSAGLDPFELYDTRELTKKIDAWYSGDGQGNAEWANLPRKFNIAISGSRGLQNVEFHHAHSYTVLL